jgi:hypothetical protein
LAVKIGGHHFSVGEIILVALIAVIAFGALCFTLMLGH